MKYKLISLAAACGFAAAPALAAPQHIAIVSDFIFGGSKITADGDCSHEIKRRLLLGRKVMTNLDSRYSKAETLLCQQRFVYSRLWFFLWSHMDVRVGL